MTLRHNDNDITAYVGNVDIDKENISFPLYVVIHMLLCFYNN